MGLDVSNNMTNWFASLLASSTIKTAIREIVEEGRERIVLDQGDEYNSLVLPKGYDRKNDPDGLMENAIGDPYSPPDSVSLDLVFMVSGKAHAASAAALDAIHDAASRKLSQVEYENGEQYAMEQAKIFYGVMGQNEGARAWGEAAGKLLAARMLGHEPDLSAIAEKLPDFGLGHFGLAPDKLSALSGIDAKIQRIVEPMELAWDEDGIYLARDYQPAPGMGGMHA